MNLSHEEAARRDQYCGVCRLVHYGNPPKEYRCVVCDTVGYDCCFSGNTGQCARCERETEPAKRFPQLRENYELWMYGSCNWDSGECRIQVRLSAAEKRVAEAHLKHLVGRQWISDFAFNKPMEPSEGLEDTLDTIARSLGEDGLKGVGHSGPVWLLKEEDVPRKLEGIRPIDLGDETVKQVELILLLERAKKEEDNVRA